ncbi:hypothetical protein FQR65_LT11043 [Abscondita terminalis]|nr:hypothetical protein FQR65_LT11043 [Abscondita terminalis]
MTKLAVLFFAALAFQATSAIPSYYEQGNLFSYLGEIKTEVRDLTLFFEKDFPEHHLAIKTVTWQSRRLIEVLEVIINKLREETFVVRGEHKVFKDVIYTLEELINNFRQVTLYNDISKVHELKKYFILTIHTVLEHFEKLVTLTNTYYPEFRYTLKYLLVDFMTALHGIRSHFVHINSGFEVVQSPRLLIKEIHEYTREFTEIFKEFQHPTQVKVALRGYVYYVNEIVRKLQDERILGHKELDLVLVHLTDKLREIVFPLMEIMHDETFDMKVFRTKIVTYTYEIVSIFEQLVQLCEDKTLPEDLTHFLVKVIYHYWYAVKHVTYEIKFGYKIGFYMPEYYNTEYYTKYGYGLYERDFHQRFYTPYHYETGKYHYPMYSKNFEYGMYTPYKYDSLFPVRSYEHVYGKSFDLPKYGLNYYNKYYKHDYKYESPKEVVYTIEMLVKRIYEHLKYNTFDVKEVRPVIVYNIREFIQFLDYFLEKIESNVHYEHIFADKLFEEFIYKIKEIRMELMEIVKTGVFTNVHEIRMRFVRYIEFVAMDLTKWFEKYGFEHVFVKDIVYRFISFLQKVTYERYTYDSEYVPMKHFTGSFYNTERYFPTYYNRWLKY